MFLYLFLFGMALGFTLTIPPGPMNALIASESARTWRLGFLTGLGAMSADMVLAAVVYAARSLLLLGRYQEIIYLPGAAVIFYFAFSVLTEREEEVKGEGRYLRALALGVSNPFQILWWLTAGLAFAYIGGVVLLSGLFSAVFVWICAFPALIHGVSNRYGRAREAVRMVSGAVMILFGAYLVYLFILHSS